MWEKREKWDILSENGSSEPFATFAESDETLLSTSTIV